jgi:hypothetical protein
MKIFPLSVAGKIVLTLIALMLGLILWVLHKPDHFKKMLNKKQKG